MENTERQPIVETLMRRDNISREEAKEQVKAFKADLMEAIESGDYNYAHDMIMDDLGLEPDYLDELIF